METLSFDGARMTVLYAVGDIAPDRPDPRECFALVRDRLRQADVGFCQLEVNITDRGVRLPQARHTHRAAPSTGAAIRDAGFDVVSFAGNHCMDWGPEGFFDTIGALERAGLQVVGVGRDIAEAREPVVVERDGRRIAFLACSSILPMSYWAEANRPGCVPMRAFTHYEAIERDQPGTKPRVHTYAHREDLAALLADVRRAREVADVVVLSIHWGIHFVPAELADYQREVAHAVIDAGVDLVLGHHAHILKGVEVYKGKAIFYSLCNFAMDLRMDEAHANSKGFKEIQGLHPRWIPDFDSLYNFPDDARMTLVVKARIDDGGVAAVSFLPTYVNRAAQPEIVAEGDPRFTQVVDYVREVSEAVGLQTRFEVRDGEVLVG
jgi:poly-gamma-glutamate synthesis protein (capsule biosynthesis protein)